MLKIAVKCFLVFMASNRFLVLVFRIKNKCEKAMIQFFYAECPFQVFESSILNDEPDSDYS